jgi:hypothetical protein
MEDAAGYDTNFYGEVQVAPPLNEAERTYLNQFAVTCRMDRERRPYFVDGSGARGEWDDLDIREPISRKKGSRASGVSGVQRARQRPRMARRREVQ